MAACDGVVIDACTGKSASGVGHMVPKPE
jgi:hypothetical protein